MAGHYMRPRPVGDSGFNGSVTVSMSSPASTGNVLQSNDLTMSNSVFPFPPIGRNTCPTSGDAWSGRYWIGNCCDEIGKRFLNRSRARRCLKWWRCPWHCGCSIQEDTFIATTTSCVLASKGLSFNWGSHLQIILWNVPVRAWSWSNQCNCLYFATDIFVNYSKV